MLIQPRIRQPSRREAHFLNQIGRMGAKILLADDEPLVQRLMERHLERAGYEMLSAFNGKEAVETATRESPQLIVMDIMMAEMDGLTALRQLKQREGTRAIPVIMITANPHDIARQESVAGGAAAFLTKPFSPARLLQEIQRLVPSGSSP
jgi:CheY-like chemotaxis protein